MIILAIILYGFLIIDFLLIVYYLIRIVSEILLLIYKLYNYVICNYRKENPHSPHLRIH